MIMRCEGFEETGVELVANIAEFRKIRDIKTDILILRILFQHFEGAGPFWRKLGQLELVCWKVLGREHELIALRMVLSWSSVLVGLLNLIAFSRVEFFCC